VRTFRVASLSVALALAALLAGCGGRAPEATGNGAGGARGQYKVGSPYQIGGVMYYPAEDFGYEETGIASWYGEDFHGKYTANGEVYDLNAMTAAHRTLPMPSVVQVTNLDNGRTMALRVNDRGPFARNRIIDVSRHAAQLLGFERQGTAKVRVKILVPESIQVASLARHAVGDDKVPPGEAPKAAPISPVATAPLPAQPGVRVAATQPQPVSLPSPLPPSQLPVATAPPPLPERVAVVPVRATQIYIQAGAFSRADNALRLKSRLDPLGEVKVEGARVNGIDLYRVRLGPIRSVDDADKLLDRVVASGIAEARIIVD
jgi:rare lipoprotein A